MVQYLLVCLLFTQSLDEISPINSFWIYLTVPIEIRPNRNKHTNNNKQKTVEFKTLHSNKTETPRKSRRSFSELPSRAHGESRRSKWILSHRIEQNVPRSWKILYFIYIFNVSTSNPCSLSHKAGARQVIEQEQAYTSMSRWSVGAQEATYLLRHCFSSLRRPAVAKPIIPIHTAWNHEAAGRHRFDPFGPHTKYTPRTHFVFFGSVYVVWPRYKSDSLRVLGSVCYMRCWLSVYRRRVWIRLLDYRTPLVGSPDQLITVTEVTDSSYDGRPYGNSWEIFLEEIMC